RTCCWFDAVDFNERAVMVETIQPVVFALLLALDVEIGRASCRERVGRSGNVAAVKLNAERSRRRTPQAWQGSLTKSRHGRCDAVRTQEHMSLWTFRRAGWRWIFFFFKQKTAYEIET